MPSGPTTVDIFTSDQWAQRFLALYPHSWTGDRAKKAGGILHSLFKAIGDEFTFQEEQLDWLLAACRVATARDIALDQFSADYFGDRGIYMIALPRLTGESDDDFRERIIANLLANGGMREDIIRVVQNLTGQTPRIIEPWNPMDTCITDVGISFLDIDTQESPCRAGDQSLRYQGFVESILPPYGVNDGNPLYTLDTGFSCDRSFIVDPSPTWFAGARELDNAINRVRPFGTTVWRKYGSLTLVNYARGATRVITEDAASKSVHLAPPAKQALIVLAQCLWNSNVYVEVDAWGDFIMFFSSAAPGGVAVDFIAAPATLPGFGILYIPPGATTASLITQTPGSVVLVTPTWNTTVILTNDEVDTAEFAFSTPAPTGSFLFYGLFTPPNGGTSTLDEDDTTDSVLFDEEIELPYQLILLPNWNTQFQITKSETGFDVTFSVPAPDGAFYYWGTFSQPI